MLRLGGASGVDDRRHTCNYMAGDRPALFPPLFFRTLPIGEHAVQGASQCPIFVSTYMAAVGFATSHRSEVSNTPWNKVITMFSVGVVKTYLYENGTETFCLDVVASSTN